MAYSIENDTILDIIEAAGTVRVKKGVFDNSPTLSNTKTEMINRLWVSSKTLAGGSIFELASGASFPRVTVSFALGKTSKVNKTIRR